jgi:hypothetical protein
VARDDSAPPFTGRIYYRGRLPKGLGEGAESRSSRFRLPRPPGFTTRTLMCCSEAEGRRDGGGRRWEAASRTSDTVSRYNLDSARFHYRGPSHPPRGRLFSSGPDKERHPRVEGDPPIVPSAQPRIHQPRAFFNLTIGALACATRLIARRFVLGNPR